MVLKEIEGLDGQDEDDALPESLRMRRVALFSHVEEINKKLESLFRQKARNNWLAFGDSNSKFYYSVIRWRKLRNEVKGVDMGGVWCAEPEVVRREALKLYEARFSASQDFGVRLDNVEFKTLFVEVSLSMVSKFSEEEVKSAICLCEGSKSPGPDDFNSNFIKGRWEVLKHDIVVVVHLFQETGVHPKRV
ncbi:uncharacterized protein [Phaseolus vulgaris]|uniref:uncharacterized protein n=1 Tax=Phaseolus vulgaris TaxID=3885 RepID=UPI0035C9BAC7